LTWLSGYRPVAEFAAPARSSEETADTGDDHDLKQALHARIMINTDVGISKSLRWISS